MEPKIHQMQTDQRRATAEVLKAKFKEGLVRPTPPATTTGTSAPKGAGVSGTKAVDSRGQKSGQKDSGRMVDEHAQKHGVQPPSSYAAVAAAAATTTNTRKGKQPAHPSSKEWRKTTAHPVVAGGAATKVVAPPTTTATAKDDAPTEPMEILTTPLLLLRVQKTGLPLSFSPIIRKKKQQRRVPPPPKGCAEAAIGDGEGIQGVGGSEKSYQTSEREGRKGRSRKRKEDEEEEEDKDREKGMPDAQGPHPRPTTIITRRGHALTLTRPHHHRHPVPRKRRREGKGDPG